MQAEADEIATEHVGLLFVHGIGEQRRFEHLKSSVGEFAELMRQTDAGISCTIVDRTEQWPHLAGTVAPDRLAPITLHVRGGASATEFHCHEVWWADLGARSGIADALKFWIWSVGQWCAPIYRELDSARLSKEAEGGQTRSVLAKLPRSIAGSLTEVSARLQLFLASLCTLFVCVTWVLAKRAFEKLLGQAPSPTLLVQYVGDVRTYEERAVPGLANVVDPGQPRRVGIRRRMVTEMVSMGSDPRLARWYVVAHSQGTVLAYNGLTEIGHALPNYLPQAQWDTLDAAYKDDPGCMRRPPEQIAQMMPARPNWIADDSAVINRPLLFGRLRGLLTYGSPLNKFAALWPRIVATAADREDDAEPFAGCTWLNVRALQDPVAGDVDAFYGRGESLPFEDRYVPPVTNVHTPWGIDYLISHVRYFAGVEDFVQSFGAAQKRAVARWLLTDSQLQIESRSHGRPWAIILLVSYLLIFGILVVIAIALVTLVGGIIAALLDGMSLMTFDSFGGFVAAWKVSATPVASVVLLVAMLAGYWRWLSETFLNRKLSALARKEDVLDGKPTNTEYWRRVELLNLNQWLVARLLLLAALLSIGLLVVGHVDDANWLSAEALERGLTTFADPRLSGLLVAFVAGAAVAQSACNRVTPTPRKAVPREL